MVDLGLVMQVVQKLQKICMYVPDTNIFLHSLCSRATDVDTQKPNAKQNYAFKQWKTIELFIIFQNFCPNKLRTTFQV